MGEMVLSLTLEIIYLLTGEDYELVKTISGKLLPHITSTSDPLPIMHTPPTLLTSKINCAKKILDVTQKITELLTGEVPIRCQDVSVYFSMEEWEYLEGHKDLYNDIVTMEDQLPLTSPALRVLKAGASVQTFNYNTGYVSEFFMFSNQLVTERIINLTLQIIYLLTRENYTIVKKESYNLLQGCYLPPLSMYNRKNYQKILEVTQKMIELLTGELPIRCQDVSVYFSMEEWEYLEGHKDLYKDIAMMEDQPPLTSPGLSWHSIRSVEKQHISHQDCSTLKASNDFHHPKDQDESHGGDIDIYLLSDNVNGAIQSSKRPMGHITDSQYPVLQQVTPLLACPLYGKTFTKKSKFSKHVKYHTVERPLSCPECDKCFTRASDLAKHAIVHTGEKPFTCIECGRSFVNKAYLAIHTRIHTGEKPYSCSECKKCFVSVSALAVHHKIHTGEKPHICSECGKCFIRKCDLAQHQNVHTGIKPFSCDECGKRFFSKSRLVLHQRVHTGERPFSCVDCKKCFSSKTQLVVHRRIHTGDRPYPCPECDKCFTRKAVLILHQSSHAGEKPYSCTECGTRFTYKTNMFNHRKIHLGVKPFPCPDCGKCFISNSEVVKHRRTHTGERPHFCSECGKCFTKKSHLNRHQRIHSGDKPSHTEEKPVRIHNGEKPYICLTCGRSYADKSYFRVHQRTHTGERPYPCPLCGKCFISQSDLGKHKQIHSERRHACVQCGKRFLKKSHLTRHQSVHVAVQNKVPF